MLLRPVWAENKQSLTTHSTVMAERDRLGKQAVMSKGAAGSYKKNKQSLTTHSTVMAEHDQSGKQAVTSKGAAGLYEKKSNP
jgi:hypothetical protein